VLLLTGLAAIQYRQRPELLEYDPEWVRRSALTSFGVLSLGTVYLVLGFAEASLLKPRKAKRKVRRLKQQPSGEAE
jgi:hypothetical protein